VLQHSNIILFAPHERTIAYPDDELNVAIGASDRALGKPLDTPALTLQPGLDLRADASMHRTVPHHCSAPRHSDSSSKEYLTSKEYLMVPPSPLLGVVAQVWHEGSRLRV